MENQAQGFEVIKYEPVHDQPSNEKRSERIRIIKQIQSDFVRENPHCAVLFKLEGNQLRMTYHGIEMGPIDQKKRQSIEDGAQEVLKSALAYMKKEFKRISHETFDFKELKDHADSKYEKISINQRFYFWAWRVFEMS